MKNRTFIVMRICAFLMVCCFGIISCRNKEKADDQSIENAGSNIIELSEAISNLKPVKLSEIADSVSFVPFSNETLLGNRFRIMTSDNYLFAGSKVFDWDGNYLFEIGRGGQGPGEEAYLHTIINVDTSFYSMADKLIAYNKAGKYAGKERLVIDIHPLDLGRAGSNIAICTLDTLYFLSSDLEILSTKRVVPDWPEKSTMMSGNANLRFFTHNEDSVLFYNYMNDTIYRVLDNAIEARWVINLGEDKIPLNYLLGDEMKRLEVGGRYFTNNALSSWEYLIDTDNKVRVFSIFESPNYVFVYWFRLFDFWQLRNLPPTQFQIAYFDKQKHRTTAVEGDGFIDDISSLGTFYPLKGIHGNSMLASYWPYELAEKADSLKQIGLPVDEKLLEVLDRTTDDNNPILVMVHLK